MYERQHGGDFEVGSYAHRAILMAPDDIPSIEASALSPTELPFTQEDFDLQIEQALELFPEIVGDERVGVRYAINGLLSLTPDGNPILGETPEVKGLWSAAAIWIKEAPGIARMVAEWMTDGTPEIDPHGSDIARFYDHHRTARAHRGAQRGGLQQDLRDRPPDGTVGLEPERPAEPRQHPPARARRGVLRGGRLGAALLVRRERAPARRVRRSGDAASGRVGIALVVADHQRRAPGDARSGRDGRPGGVRDLRRDRAGRHGLPRGARRQPGRRARRDGSSTRRSSTPPAGSSPTSRSSAWPTTATGW